MALRLRGSVGRSDKRLAQAELGPYNGAVDQRSSLSFSIDLPGGLNRLREATLYVCKACKDAERFGKVKLNKILWRADFKAFAERRMPVTGRTYQKLTAGPAPLEMPLVLAEMQAEGLLRFERLILARDYIEDRPTALVNANLKDFSPNDIGYLDESVAFYWAKSATRASDLSHGIAWKSREYLDPIPYEAAFLSDRKMSTEEKKHFSDLMRSKGWTSL